MTPEECADFCLGGECEFCRWCEAEGCGGGDGLVCDGSNCDSFSRCGQAIPAVSEWGMVVVTLLVLTVGTIMFRQARRRVVTT